jgi:hypothetical protein
MKNIKPFSIFERLQTGLVHQTVFMGNLLAGLKSQA